MLRIFCVLMITMVSADDALGSSGSIEGTTLEVPEADEIPIVTEKDIESDATIKSLENAVSLKEAELETEKILTGKLKDDTTKLSTEKQQLEVELSQLKANLESMNSVKEDAVKELGQLKSDMELTVSSKENIEKEMEDLKAILESANLSKDNAVTELNQLKSDMEVSSSLKENVEKEKEELKAILESANLAKDNAVTELNQLKSDMELSLSSRENADKEMERLKATLDSVNLAKDNAVTELNQLKKDFKSAEEAHQAGLASSLSSCEASMAAAAKAHEEAKEEHVSKAEAHAEQLSLHETLKARVIELEAPKDLMGILNDVRDLTLRSSRGGLIGGAHLLTKANKNVQKAVVTSSTQAATMLDDHTPSVLAAIDSSKRLSMKHLNQLGSTLVSVTENVTAEAKISATFLYDTHLKEHHVKATTIGTEMYEKKIKEHVDKVTESSAPHLNALSKAASEHLSNVAAMGTSLATKNSGEFDKALAMLKAWWKEATRTMSRYWIDAKTSSTEAYESNVKRAVQVLSEHLGEEDALVVVDATLILCGLLFAMVIFRPLLCLVRVLFRLVFSALRSICSFIMWILHVKMSILRFAVRVVLFPFKVLLSPFTLVYSLVKGKKKAPPKERKKPGTSGNPVKPNKHSKRHKK